MSTIKRDGNYAYENKHYLDLVDESRAQQYKITQDTVKRLNRMFEQTASELAEKAKKAGKKSLTRRWALDYEKEVCSVLKHMQSVQYDITVNGMRKATQNGTYVQMSFFEELLSQYSFKASDSFKSVLSRIPEKAMNEIISGRIYTNSRGLSKRIWQNTKGLEKDIGYIIEQALLAKKSAIELALDLEKYVNDDAITDYTWGKVYPKLEGKQCSYEAQRLARTSINHAYQLATIRAAKDNPFVDGLKWEISNHSGVCKACKSREGRIYSADNVPLDHPNGRCTLIPHISKSLDEISAELKAWVNGAENAKLTNWLNFAA